MVLKHKGYGAYISCDDVALEEFAVKEEDEKTISCYVCSEAGKNFKLHYEDYGEVEGHIDASSVGGKLAKEVHFYLDGQWCSGVNRGHGENGFKADALTGESERKLFIFQELVTTDDDSVTLQHGFIHADLGCIEFRTWRTFADWKPSNHGSNLPPRLGAPIHERSKKMSSHCVGLGDVSSKKRNAYSNATKYDKQVYVKFRFYYRRRDVLQAQGIIPLTPVPQQPPTPVKRQYESDSDEEVKEDVEQMQARLQRLQKQIDKKISKKARTVKQEPVARRVPSTSSNQVIDLT